ncbi:translation elongation factor 2 (EF-2/EF-G) [Fervidobacterium changbaicum]|uniref:Elongation factor G n=2 Tax=Fervidobacterium TaxID=2422 RepID=A0AAI8GC75_FERIS|nr:MULTISPECIES: elongation factor G [Fervidobacterium]AMW31910.1 elongation factor G [Fervidobacterium islandicum]QAV33685.1 elongation factor G [Fervidobacterium changbaicum]SDH39921.1 translation elongation factor 2 (EF-2/EF-G) [Fervidobacterium changbaicum]
MVAKDKRTVALVGHNGSGKSALMVAALNLGGMNVTKKEVDFDPIEAQRGASINSHVGTFKFEGKQITLVDTPGFSDFIGEVISAIFVSENVISVINATAGVEIQTERTWALATEMEKPIMVFINQMDKERASFENSLASLKERFEAKIVPIVYPVGAEANFKGVVDLISGKAYLYENGKPKETEIPAEVKDKVEEIKMSIMEDIVSLDDTLMEKYFAEEPITPEELWSALRKGFIERQIVPVLAGSAEKNIGVDVLLRTLNNIGASPLEAKPYKARLESGDEVDVVASETDPFVGYTFKAVVDPFVGKLSYIKVVSGVLKPGDTFVNVTRGSQEKVGHLYFAKGKETYEVEEASCGDVVVLPKLKESAVRDTLTHKDRKLAIIPPVYPEPMISKSVNPKSKSDIDKISNGLSRLADSDPTFAWEFDPETSETVISGIGGMHLDVMVERLKNIFGVDVEVGKPKIAYRETVMAKAISEHKHKKQTGGHGQYGHVKIEIEPLERGAGFEFVDKIVGGVIPRNFIPSVEKGIREAMKKGVLAAYPVVDVRVTLFDGSYHEVDSSDISFQIAAIQAFKKGMQQARPVLLEPVMYVEVFTPDENAGDVMGDISSRRGRPMGMEPAGKGMTVVKAEVPLAEMLDFQSRLSSITSGRGYFTMRFAKYDIVPPNIQEKIIAERKKYLEQQAEE